MTVWTRGAASQMPGRQRCFLSSGRGARDRLVSLDGKALSTPTNALLIRPFSLICRIRRDADPPMHSTCTAAEPATLSCFRALLQLPRPWPAPNQLRHFLWLEGSTRAGCLLMGVSAHTLLRVFVSSSFTAFLVLVVLLPLRALCCPLNLDHATF